MCQSDFCQFSFQCSFSVLYDTASSLKLVASSLIWAFHCGGFAASSAMSCWHGRAAFVEQACVCSSGVSKLWHNMERTWNSSFWCALESFFFPLTDIFCHKICQGPVILHVVRLSALFCLGFLSERAPSIHCGYRNDIPSNWRW